MNIRLSPASEESFQHELDVLLRAEAASRLAQRDPDLWGDSCSEVARERLGWVDLADPDDPVIERAEELRREFAKHGVHRWVLAGMGGSSLGAAVLSRALEADLTILDTTAPAAVRRAFGDDLNHTGLIVASKSGTTVETRSHLAAFEEACRQAGLNPAEHTVAITDAGSEIDDESRFAAVFTAPSDIGGRFSVFSPFGLVPTVMAGGDPRPVAAAAARSAAGFGTDESNPALDLAAFLSSAHARDVDKLVLADQTGVGLGRWIEQLVAESLGKDGRGLLPIAVTDIDSPLIADAGPDVATLSLIFPGTGRTPAQPVSEHFGEIEAELGEALYMWEFATALLAYSTAVNPFDQPNVESAKACTRRALDRPSEAQKPELVFSYENLDVSGDEHVLGAVRSVTGLFRALADAIPEFGYIAVQAYVDPKRFPGIERFSEAVFRATGIVTTFSFGPAYLHSTGQYHKGGRNNGAFIQITADEDDQLAVPGADCTFAELIEAQADGDYEALRTAERPIARIHLREDGWAQLAKVVQMA